LCSRLPGCDVYQDEEVAGFEAFRSLTSGPEHGVIKAKLVKIAGAVRYLVQWGVVPPGGGTPASWTTLPIAQVRSATTIAGLTPATTYVFQARAVTPNGYTGWSDPIIRVAL
jgi:hypothetical protein